MDCVIGGVTFVANCNEESDAGLSLSLGIPVVVGNSIDMLDGQEVDFRLAATRAGTAVGLDESSLQPRVPGALILSRKLSVALRVLIAPRARPDGMCGLRKHS